MALFPQHLYRCSSTIGGPNGPLTMDLARIEDAQEMYKFALQYVYSTPLMRRLFQAEDGDLESIFDFWHQMIRQTVSSHSYSLVVRDRNKKLVGISVATVLNRHDYNPIPMGEVNN